MMSCERCCACGFELKKRRGAAADSALLQLMRRTLGKARVVAKAAADQEAGAIIASVETKTRATRPPDPGELAP